MFYQYTLNFCVYSFLKFLNFYNPIFVVFVVYVGKLMGKIRASISTRTDKRVKLMNEIISGIQVIKMYAWEKSFEKIVKMARLDEVKRISNASQLRGVFSTCVVILERSSLFFTIICFVLQGKVCYVL